MSILSPDGRGCDTGLHEKGDVEHGSKTVVDAVREAKIAAHGIMEYIESGM